jgi:hypothetical protein
MAFLSALSAGDKTNIRAHWEGDVYLSQVLNTNIYTARINQSSFNTPLAELEYDGGAGTLGNVEVGMTILISATNDKSAAYFRGRIRKTPDADTFFINETTGGQFSDDDYIFVVDDFAIHEKNPHVDNDIIYVDWDVSFRRLKPIISNLQSAYVDFIDTGTSVYTIAFAPDVAAADNDATGAITYLWDEKDGTITVGVDTDKNVTITFPAGERWISFTATDSNGVSETRRIFVKAHDRTTNMPETVGFGNVSISASVEGGYTASISGYTGFDTILDQTMVVLWVDQRYARSETDITDNILFVGRLRQADNITQWEGGQQEDEVAYDLEGPIAQLARIRAASITAINTSSPDEWFEIEDVTPWRVAHLILSELSTFTTLHSITYDPGDETFLFDDINTEVTSLLESVNQLADNINAILQQRANGECEFARNAPLMASADRSGLVTVLDITTDDIVTTLDHLDDPVYEIGRIDSDAGSYDSTADEVNPLLAGAPSGSAGPGTSNAPLRSQILTANASVTAQETEAKQRAGDAFALQEAAELTIQMRDGNWFLEPDQNARYTVTLDGTETAQGIVLTTATKWQLLEKTISIEPVTGTIEVVNRFRQETSGNPGAIIALPVINEGQYPSGLGTFDPGFADLPPSTDDFTTDIDFTVDDGGFEAGTGSHAPGTGWQPACVGGTSEFLDISKDLDQALTLTSITVLYDATYAGGADNQNKIYTRVSGGVWRLHDTFTTQTGVAQSRSVQLNNVVADGIRVIMYAGGSDCTGALDLTDISWVQVAPEQTFTHVFNFQSSTAGFEPYDPGIPRAEYSAGWIYNTDPANEQWWNVVQIQHAAGFSSTFITTVTMIVSEAPDLAYQLRAPDVGGAEFGNSSPPGGLTSITWNVNTNLTGFWLSVDNSGTGFTNPYTGKILSLTVSGEGADPF